MAGRNPGVQSPEQGADSRVAKTHQFSRDGGSPGLVGARTVKDDLAIRRQSVEPLIYFCKVHYQGARNETTILIPTK